MTRDYSKSHNNDHDAPAPDAPAPDATPAPVATPAPARAAVATPASREKAVWQLHEADIEKAKADIAALVQKAQAVEYAREDPNSAKPEYELIAELQDLFRQVHRLNAKWLVTSAGYEYVPPPAVPPVASPSTEPGAPPVNVPRRRGGGARPRELSEEDA